MKGVRQPSGGPKCRLNHDGWGQVNQNVPLPPGAASALGVEGADATIPSSVVVTAQPLPIDDRPDDHEGEGGDGAEAQGHAALNQMYKEINLKKGPCQGLGKASHDPNDLVKNNRSLGGAKEDGVPRTNQRATRGQTKIPTLTVTQSSQNSEPSHIVPVWFRNSRTRDRV